MGLEKNRLDQEQYHSNFEDIHPPFENYTAALVEANRCLYCYDAPCIKSCPTSINVPKFIKQIATENIKGSAHTIFSSNIMGGGCARVCPVEKLCEGACVYNFLEEEPIQIARLQRYSTDKALLEKWPLFTRKESVGKRVAVIGAGPAGLSCAHTLSREGIDVIIYEKEQKGGGLMTYGIAAYKVTPQFCQDEVDYITSLGGISIEYGRELGEDLSLESLKTEFDAVFLAIGVGLTRELGIPGEDVRGVEDAIDFIYKIRTQEAAQVAVGDQVVVIGMGMTAIDAATQAKRLGAKEVTLVYRRTQAEMPCTQKELDLAKTDGCKIIWLAAPKEILSLNGEITGLVCDVMKAGAADSSGRMQPEITGRTIVIEADMLIKATGQLPFQELINRLSIEHYNGKVILNGQGESSMTGVFAGGDCVNGGKEVVDAVQAGKDAAAGILEFLELNTYDRL